VRAVGSCSVLFESFEGSGTMLQLLLFQKVLLDLSFWMFAFWSRGESSSVLESMNL
jgi:hypothetical protein